MKTEMTNVAPSQHLDALHQPREQQSSRHTRHSEFMFNKHESDHCQIKKLVVSPAINQVVCLRKMTAEVNCGRAQEYFCELVAIGHLSATIVFCGHWPP